MNGVTSGTVNPLIEHAAPVNLGTPPNQALPTGSSIYHGSVVGSKIIGNQLGVCKQCTMAWFVDQKFAQNSPGYYYFRPEYALSQLSTAMRDILAKKRVGKAVLNMSFGLPTTTTQASKKGWCKYLTKATL